MVDYRILGSLEVASDGTIADLGAPKQRALLAILLLHANEVVPVDRLIDLLWPDHPPRQAAHAIQVYVSELRRILQASTDADVIAWRSPGYVLSVDPERIDVSRVERLVGEATRASESGDAVGARATLAEARAQWRGATLADFPYEEFAQAGIRHATELWHDATETLAAVDLELGLGTEAVTLATAAIEEDPFRERPIELAMLALYRVGRHAEALRVFEDYRRRLAGELGAQPPPDLCRLQERILVHDSTLPTDSSDGVGRVPSGRRNPYKGVRPFGEGDSEDFFGRAALVDRLVAALDRGARLLAIVGPSGCGKSSLLGAGLLPVLRRRQAQSPRTPIVVRMRPGPRPLDALEAAVRPCIAGAQPKPGFLAAGDDPLLRVVRTAGLARGRVVLVIDQFEEVFAAADPAEPARFLANLASVVGDADAGVAVVLALRADMYDRPLLHPAFAALLVPGVIHLLPMTAGELEQASVEPARRAGIAIEPALLAQLVGDSLDRPGALPLLQHALAELFDGCTSDRLGLAAYRAIGGINGSLSRRAEAVFAGLDEAHRRAGRDLILRAIRLDDDGRAGPRRVPIRELTGLGLDPVVLSDVLAAFDRGRLITFDRDPINGDRTAEVAHEALLVEWPRVASWIADLRSDLRRQAALAARVAEWDAAGRLPEDLLTGSRLDELAAWSRDTALPLTATERAFVDAGVEHRTIEREAEAARIRRQRGLERTARVRLAGLIVAAILIVAAATYGILAPPAGGPDVVLLYPGPGDGGMYDSIERGFDGAVERNALDGQRVIERQDQVENRLRRLSDQGAGLIVVGFDWSNPEVERVARIHPETHYLAIDYAGELANVAAPEFAREEGAYLAGIAAALASRTGTVGIVAEADDDTDWPLVAGFEAGARTARPTIDVLVAYLMTPPRYQVVTYAMVNREARAQYRAGADVVYYARSWLDWRSRELGLFEAATSESTRLGRHLWAIGDETDWQAAIPVIASQGGFDAEGWDDHILASLITRYDLAIGRMLDDHATDGFTAGTRPFGLAEGAFELVGSGAVIDAIRPALDAAEERVVEGTVVVPRFPDDRGPPR